MSANWPSYGEYITPHQNVQNDWTAAWWLFTEPHATLDNRMCGLRMLCELLSDDRKYCASELISLLVWAEHEVGKARVREDASR